jgi:phage gp46-like protein
VASSSALQLADLALSWSNKTGDADLSLIDLDLASERGLQTAVMLSLFTDRRAETDDQPPSGDARDRRGWWADQFADIEGDLIGSRLWLLDRSKRINETALRAKEYANESLAWMLEDRVVSGVNVTVETSEAMLLFVVELQRPGRDAVSFRFAHTWEHLQEDS